MSPRNNPNASNAVCERAMIATVGPHTGLCYSRVRAWSDRVSRKICFVDTKRFSNTQKNKFSGASQLAPIPPGNPGPVSYPPLRHARPFVSYPPCTHSMLFLIWPFLLFLWHQMSPLSYGTKKVEPQFLTACILMNGPVLYVLCTRYNFK